MRQALGSNHAKRARTNAAHTVLDPEAKTRYSPRSKTSSIFACTAAISLTSEASAQTRAYALRQQAQTALHDPVSHRPTQQPNGAGGWH